MTNDIYYYTSFNNFKNIININKGIIDLTANSLFYHTKTIKGYCCDQHIKDFIQVIEKHLSINETERISEFFSENNFEKFVKSIDFDFVDKLNQQTYFVLSFSKSHESVPLWHIKGDKGSGLILVFDKQEVEKINGLQFFDIIYTLDDKSSKLIEAYKKAQLFFRDEFINKLTPCTKEKYLSIKAKIFYQFFIFYFSTYDFKMYDFQEEFIGIFQQRGEFGAKGIPLKEIIPAVILSIPLAYLKEVILGPKISNERNLEILTTFFNNKSFNIPIRYSDLSYRG
ncbi:hypothetical protein TRIP_D390008 [uncultured Paludibacter sp.]|nr:hypothetical protein TRIP_D390008 [uncultured Paludibacter sp.]